MTKCCVKNCEKNAKNSGMCWAHYTRKRKYGDPNILKRATPNMNPPEACEIPGCDKAHYAKGLCVAHYTRLRRHQSPTGGRTPVGDPMQWIRQNIDFQGDECLIWPFAKARGYGMLTLDGRQRVTANFICSIINGPAPTKKHECAHSCGNGAHGCVNPNHLRWATRAENHSDKTTHGTDFKGERHPFSKITEKQAIEIIQRKGEALIDLATEFGITKSTVSAIQTGKRWGHLQG